MSGHTVENGDGGKLLTTPALAIRVNRRARNISLRVDPASGRVILTIPTERALADGLRFAARKTGWIERQLATMSPRVPFRDGNVIPLRGRSRRIRHRPDICGGVFETVDEILVGGTVASLSTTLREWLRATARAAIEERAREFLGRRGCDPVSIALRDPKSRWGSCSAKGTLSFSWRLVLAPEMVLSYVVAHEVAHLEVFTHGPRFWRKVAELEPDYATAEAWLRRHGNTLHRYG